ncbi:hypothetical protein D081_1874 [Anaerovibrio sp. JC8]|uniref:late competence development ComFB family protein n=1 Tax=Anaerovibrio sp. JC8 TaxID=1240085 RepID=UPI000A09FB0A|nr:late competence development ComFB family protein [Anaerovibrio sp. JC8]ORT99499.1 hypothetical protein D081_1874 [Anaerovibrio sp. JC8]
MVLKNYMEDYVVDKIERLAPRYPDCCWCEKCKRDVAILALNHLPAKYASTEKGQVFTRVESMERDNEIEIIKQIAEATNIVRAHPRH